MTPARYEEIAKKVYAFSGKLLSPWLDALMSIDDNGTVGNYKHDEFLEGLGWPTFGQNDVTALLKETGIPALELREWARLEEIKEQKEFDEAVERTIAEG